MVIIQRLDETSEICSAHIYYVCIYRQQERPFPLVSVKEEEEEEEEEAHIIG
jgi:hypothetical protein